jgi:hypothetical protein
MFEVAVVFDAYLAVSLGLAKCNILSLYEYGHHLFHDLFKERCLQIVC